MILWADLAWIAPLLNLLILVVGLFLILLVLIQRGKGGGLAGAFGGAGGSSAFGSRAGDAFTKITIYVAAFWVLLIMITIKTVQPPLNAGPPPEGKVQSQTPEQPPAPPAGEPSQDPFPEEK